MSDAGYSLTETLVAIIMLALAIGGLTWGLQVINRWQMTTGVTSADVSAVRAAQTGLERLFAGMGPFRSDKAGEFDGTASGFSFACAGLAPCAVTLSSDADGLALDVRGPGGGTRHWPLRRSGSAHFVYRGRTGDLSSWPPLGSRQVLRSVALVGDDPAPLLAARIWRQEPGDCPFDPVLQDCR